MRIAFFHELYFGGARRVVYEYANELSRHHKIDLFYVDRNAESEIEKKFSSSYFYKFTFREYKGGDFLLKLYKDFIEPVKLYLLHKKIAEEINHGNYDFVFVHPSRFTHTPFLLRFLKTKSVYFCHEPLRIIHDPLFKTEFIGLKGFYEKMSRNLKKIIDESNIRRGSLVLTNSDYTRKSIKNAYGIDSHTCYLGVNPHIFKPVRSGKKYDLIFVGEKVWTEGFDTLQKVIDLYKKSLKVKIIESEKGRYISDKELAKEYNKAKVLVLLARNDPFSMIPLEGMACGIPAIVVKEGGPIEVVKEAQTGFLVKRDEKMIKNTIDQLLADPALRVKVGLSGRKDVLDNWTWEKSCGRLIKIVNKYL